jgi:methenyltetrahydromethanopterin cyclohydrolase
MHLGATMRGGEIAVHGSAGDWAGAEMQGGLIRIMGNAGHGLGGAYRGSRRGMKKGTIIVTGNAGNELGATMRRGLIAVLGNVGDFCGAFMIAGSILVFGQPARAGAGLKRGTIVTFRRGLLTTFRGACTYHDFLRMLLEQLRTWSRDRRRQGRRPLSALRRRHERLGQRRDSGLGGQMISVNEGAAKIVEGMVAQAESLGIQVSRLPGGARAGSACRHPAACRPAALSEVCLRPGPGHIPAAALTLLAARRGRERRTLRPSGAWRRNMPVGHQAREDFDGSGLARALAVVEKLYEKLEYRDKAEAGVIVLEGRQLPTDEVATYIAGKCGINPASLTLLIAPTASVAGSIQISARVVETGLHKMVELGFDVRQIVSGYGTAPIATVDKDDLHAIGRTNDCILYGGQVYYSVRADDAEVAALVERIPPRPPTTTAAFLSPVQAVWRFRQDRSAASLARPGHDQ